ncbi:Uncharacterised protein [Serratia marcescens]|nr:Uncharacterised protein [Serratia marcescens]
MRHVDATTPDGFCWLTPQSEKRTERAPGITDFANHAPTCLATTALTPEQSVGGIPSGCLVAEVLTRLGRVIDPELAVMGQQRPDDPRILVGQCHCRHIRMTMFHPIQQPTILPFWLYGQGWRVRHGSAAYAGTYCRVCSCPAARIVVSSVLIATKRILGRATASQIASASVRSLR